MYLDRLHRYGGATRYAGIHSMQFSSQGSCFSLNLVSPKRHSTCNLFTDLALLLCKVIDLAVIGLNIKYLDPVAESQVDLLNRLIAAQAFITSATTLASTAIIVYQIHSTTREIPSNSKRLLAHILEILVQSAAAYSLMAIAYAISGVVPQSVNGNEVSWVTATDYITNLFNFTAVSDHLSVDFLCYCKFGS